MMRPVRTLFVSHSPNLGGAEFCLQTTLQHLDRSKILPVVAFPFEGPMSEQTRSWGIETVVVPMCHWLYFRKDAWYWRNLVLRSFGNVKRLTGLLQEFQIDLVYTNTGAIFESAFAAKRHGVPHVWHIHEVFRRGNEMQQLLPLWIQQRLIVRNSDHVVFESESARKAFSGSVVPPVSSVVHNSVRLQPVENGDEARAKFRRNHGISDDSVLVAAVGQLIDRKNPQLLVDAVAKLSQEVNVHCMLVGEGPLHERLENQINVLGLNHRCRILPFQKDIVSLMNGIDILVLPSRQESFGLVLVEAGAMRRPVIACRSEGPSEIIDDGTTGLLVAQENAGALAEAIESLAGSTALRSAMGEAAHHHVWDRFCPVRNTRRLEQLMVDTLASVSRR